MLTFAHCSLEPLPDMASCLPLGWKLGNLRTGAGDSPQYMTSLASLHCCLQTESLFKLTPVPLPRSDGINPCRGQKPHLSDSLCICTHGHLPALQGRLWRWDSAAAPPGTTRAADRTGPQSKRGESSSPEARVL